MATFFDLAKAFDCMNQEILIQKLIFYGFDKNSIALMKSYFTNRKQFVLLKGTKSKETNIKHGVPQGSILGPLLFLIYINDFPCFLRIVKTILFADDTTILFANDVLEELLKYNKEALLLSQLWFEANKLCLNHAKTHNMILTLRNIQLDNTNSVKFLGINLNKHLNWEEHINAVAGKISKALYCLRNLKNKVSISTLKLVYYAYLQSHITYGIIIWGHSPQATRLFNLQRRAIRIIYNIGFTENCKQAFIDLNILTLPCIYIMECLIYIHSNKNSFTSDQIHSHNTRNKNMLRIPFTRLNKCRYSRNYFCIKFFNVLPTVVQDLPLPRFKTKIKNYLLGKAFYSCEEYIKNNFNDLNSTP